MTKPSTNKINWIPSLMHANLFSCLDTKYAYSLWQDTGKFFAIPPPLFPTKSLDFMLLIDIRNVLQSNEFVWNQSHIYQISCTQSLYIQTNTSYAQFIYHNLNEIKWILAKVFGTFRDIVISSVTKPRPFWVFWWLRFFHLHIQTRRLVFILNKSNKRKKLYPDITSYINY